MGQERTERKWREFAEAAFTGMAEWRQQHPKATFREIEAAVDEQLSVVRARMLEDVALASAATEIIPGSKCPGCGHEFENRGKQSRKLLTNHDREVESEARLRGLPSVWRGRFPPSMRSWRSSPAPWPLV